MQTSKPTYYDTFRCLADKCPDTCCKGWIIDISNDAMEHYKTFDGEFGARMANATDNYQSGCFIQKDGKCPFLSENNLCEIYLEKGEENVKGLCATYPRFCNDFGGYRERGLFLSCPDVAKTVCDYGRIEYTCEITEEPITCFHNLDADLFFFLQKAKSVFLSIAEDTKHTLDEKCLTLLYYAKLYQNEMKKKSYFLHEKIIWQSGKLKEPKKKQFEKLEVLSVSIYNRYEETAISSLTSIQESNLLSYFLHRYVMTACFDKKLADKIQFAVGSVLTISKLSGKFALQSECARQYCKEVEHSDKNMEVLQKEWRNYYGR